MKHHHAASCFFANATRVGNRVLPVLKNLFGSYLGNQVAMDMKRNHPHLSMKPQMFSMNMGEKGQLFSFAKGIPWFLSVVSPWF